MTPDNFRSKRQQAGMSVNECAEYLCNASRTVRRYEDGSRSIPGPVAKLMEMLTTGDRDE